MFARLLRRLADAVCRYRVSFVWPQIVLFCLSVLYAAYELKVDMNRDHLVGAKSRYYQIVMKTHREFPAPDELVVVVESTSPERNRQFVERLAARVETQTNLFNDLFYKGDLTTLGSKALLLVPENDLEQIRQTLHDNRPFLQQIARATNLNSLFDIINQQFLNAGTRPNAGAKFVIQALPALQRVVDQATHSLLTPGPPPSPGVAGLLGMGEQTGLQSYINYDQGRLFLLTVRPKTEALIPSAIEHLRQLMRATQIEVPGLNAGLTGGPVLDYDEMRQSEHDSFVASVVSLVLCSLIFIVAYRGVKRPLKAAFCLVIGLGCTLGYAAVAVGHLNILTVTFAPMLIGLAIDFGVHFISRYEEEMRLGRTLDQAIRNTTTFTGQGIVTGAFTTASAFLAMGLCNFKAVREMGVIAGGGLLICLVPMMTMLPALLTSGPCACPAPEEKDAASETGPKPKWQSGLSMARRLRIERLWMEHPVPVILITLALCAIAGLQFRNVHFDYDLLQLQSQATSSVVYEKKLIQTASQSVIFATVLADNQREARNYAEKIKRLPSVASVQSAADYLEGDQSRKLEVVRAIKREVQDLHFAPIDSRPVRLDQLGATLWYLTGFLGLSANAAQSHDPGLARQLQSLRESIIRFRRAIAGAQPQVATQLASFQRAFLEDLHRTFEAIQTQDTSGPMRPEDLPPVLRSQFIGVTGKYLLQVYPKKDIWRHENQRELLADLYSVVPEDRVNGTPLGMYEYTTLLKNSYEQAAWYALAAIVVVIALHFRSLASVILALLPVAIGSTLLLGFMGAVGISFNPANIMTLPLVIGIGVTNGVQILNRLAEEQKPSVFGKSTGKAVLVSGLTATVGFGSLILAKHQGIRSLGIVMSVGIAACMIAALTFLPALLGLLMRRGWTLKIGAYHEPVPAGAS